MIQRTLGGIIRRYATTYPVVAVNGPRQSGKTTLVTSLFPDYTYVNLEAPDVREYARNDPRGFLGGLGRRVILDEVQNVPELFSYLQVEVDARREMGQFILTGSQNFAMMERISQSLAGRVAIATLLPLGVREGVGILAKLSIDDLLFSGFYPRVHDDQLDPSEALRFYLQTYVERDVRQLIRIGDLDRFHTFLRLCAGRVGQLLNSSALGSEVGVSHNTIREWLSVLEASYLIFRLRPFHANLGKRLVKTPKLYFVDVGLASHLLGIRERLHLSSHPLRGALFENLVVAEALKQRFHSGKDNNLYFFRDQSGNEVDLVAEEGANCHAIEIKSGQTVNRDFFKNLDRFAKLAGNVASSTLVYGGTSKQNRTQHSVVPWNSFHLPEIMKDKPEIS